MSLAVCRAQPPSIWAKAVNGSTSVRSLTLPRAMTVDAAGNTYITGGYYGTVDFDPGAGTQSFSSPDGYTVYVSKYDKWGNLAWVKTFPGGATASAQAQAIALDAAGNIYLTGRFNGLVDFDPGTGTQNITSTGDDDIFIVKLDNTGGLLWVKTMGGTSTDIGYGIGTDAAGNVFIAGGFFNTVDFDPGPGTATLVATGQNVFILKLDAAGNYVWAKNIGGAGSDQANGISIDATGNVYIGGNYEQTVNFDPGGSNQSFTSVAAIDIFILKLDAAGNYIWAKTIGGPNSQALYAIATDASGNLYLTGYYYGSADFDPGTGVQNFTAAGLSDIFILKLDAAGNFVWVAPMGGSGGDVGASIALDASGNVYTTGNYEQTIDVDPGPGVHTLTSQPGKSDMFVLKLDATGNYIWAGTMGGTSSTSSSSIAVNSDDDLYITGNFTGGPLDLDPGAGTRPLTATGYLDMFLNHLSYSTSLPLTLLQFQANNNATSVLLQWQTTNEQNTASFSIERSADGRLYNAIGSVAATNNAITNNYTFNDIQPLSGIAYYRLKMMDANGAFTYSRVVAVKRKENNAAVQVFPNPATNVLYVQANGQGMATVQVTNANAQVLQQQQVQFTGNTAFSVNIQQLPAGCYYLTIQHGQEKTVQVFLKQ